MSTDYQSYKNKIEFSKLKKLMNDKKITRQQMILFLKKEGEKVFKTESDDDIIARINKGFGLDYVTKLLPKMRVKGQKKPPKANNKYSCTLIFYQRFAKTIELSTRRQSKTNITANTKKCLLPLQM